VQGKVKRNVDLLKALIRAIFREISLVQTPDLERRSANGKVGRSAYRAARRRGLCRNASPEIHWLRALLVSWLAFGDDPFGLSITKHYFGNDLLYLLDPALKFP